MDGMIQARKFITSLSINTYLKPGYVLGCNYVESIVSKKSRSFAQEKSQMKRFAFSKMILVGPGKVKAYNNIRDISFIFRTPRHQNIVCF